MRNFTGKGPDAKWHQWLLAVRGHCTCTLCCRGPWCHWGPRAAAQGPAGCVCVCVHVIKPTPLRPGTAAEPLRKRREGPWGMARG